MIAKRSKKHLRAANRLAADMLLAPAVAAVRTPILFGETGPFRTESIRAVSEKTGALMEGVVAAQISLSISALRFWPEIFSGRIPSLLSGVAAERVIQAALAPSGKRVRANFRRLTGKPG